MLRVLKERFKLPWDIKPIIILSYFIWNVDNVILKGFLIHCSLYFFFIVHIKSTITPSIKQLARPCY